MLRGFSALESLAVYVDFAATTAGKVIAGRVRKPLPIEVDAEKMDLDAMCAALREAVPSANLKRVRLTLKGHWKRGRVTVEIGESEA